MKTRLISVVTAVTAAAFLLLAAGCHVQETTNPSNGGKNVSVETPLGGLHVRSDTMTAADLGLPVYPGATPTKDHDGNQSTNVHMGFGKWQMQVKVVHYHTPDSQDKVLAFYQQALGRFGNVIRCQDNKPVGTPTSTSEGLNCSDTQVRAQVNVNIHNGNVSTSNGLSLKAGSPHHQHVLAIDSSSKGPGTSFSLVEVELPDNGTGD